MTEAEQLPSTSVKSIDGEAPGTGARRLPFVDGVRGTAALVVLIGHLIFLIPDVSEPRPAQAGVLDWLAWPFRFGTEMVYLFLLVSGFSLYYSELARRSRNRPPTTYRQFIARRAWRIGPVYYVAVALGLLVIPVADRLSLRPENAVTLHTSVGGLISHLFFVHNLNSDWVYQLNGPLWSIAYEVQLYLLFPVLIYAMRRWNPLLVAVVLVAAVKVVSLADLGFPVFGLARWFVAGALLAELSYRGIRVPVRVALPIGLAALLLGMAQVSTLVASELRHDAVWVIAFVFLMLAALENPGGLGNPMAWRWIRWVGLRSYSLYALHYPLLIVVFYGAQRAGIHGWAAAGFAVGVGVPAAILVAVVSFRFVEGPSLVRVAQVGRDV